MTKNIILASTTAVFSLLTIGASLASPAESLSKCYDRIIAVCNETAHPQGCASHGMDECDKVHPKPMTFDPKQPLFGVKLAAPVPQATIQR